MSMPQCQAMGVWPCPCGATSKADCVLGSSESRQPLAHQPLLKAHVLGPRSLEKVNTGNNFCRTCGCHFPPDDEDRACRVWEKCQEAQAPVSASPPAEKDEPVPNLYGCREFITAIMTGGHLWPNSWGQDVAAAALAVHNLRVDRQTFKGFYGAVSVELEELKEAAQSASGAIQEIAAERQRQVEKEGWSSEHDDGHSAMCLAVAGACYALYAASRDSGEEQAWRDRYAGAAYELWPWDEEWRKPKDTRRDLVRAAALIIAEIDKLDRAALASRSKP